MIAEATISDAEALLITADNIENYWGEIAARSLDGVEYDARIVRVAAREAQHLREIAARLRGDTT
jgi:hypothetical protein